MFKQHAHFSAAYGTPEHPGQPVHSDIGFDVWREANGRHFLIEEGGTRRHFDSQQAAESHARIALSPPPAAANPVTQA